VRALLPGVEEPFSRSTYMSFGADEEILQDFLVEAGEILELLSEQLVELESRPDDADLLNAIFRGFHTVKGGAGFLQAPRTGGMLPYRRERLRHPAQG
jgi:chemotaxis protein histidine kinase CheA